MKYDPYQGFDHSPWLFYNAPGYPERVKTTHDYIYRQLPPVHSIEHEWHRDRTQRVTFCPFCGKIHCSWCGCWHPWKKFNKIAMRKYLKQQIHRQFRRQAKRLIWRELDGDDAVCHNIIVSGDWLD